MSNPFSNEALARAIYNWFMETNKDGDGRHFVFDHNETLLSVAIDDYIDCHKLAKFILEWQAKP